MPPRKQTKIEKTHARLAKERQQRKDKDPTCEMGDVIELMDRAATELDALPEDFDFSDEALDRLETVRHQAIRVKFAAEAILDFNRER